MLDNVLCIVNGAIFSKVDDARCIHQKRGLAIVNILRLMRRIRLVFYDNQEVSDLRNVFRVSVSATTLFRCGLQRLLYVGDRTPIGVELYPNIFELLRNN